MDAIVAQLQQLTKTSSSENPNTSKDIDTNASWSRGRDKKDNNPKDKEEETFFYINEESNKNKDKVLKDNQTTLDALTHKEVLQKVGSYAHTSWMGFGPLPGKLLSFDYW